MITLIINILARDKANIALLMVKRMGPTMRINMQSNSRDITVPERVP